jgi:hypothetical protein
MAEAETEPEPKLRVLPMIFRLLLVGDSHVRRVEATIRSLYPEMNLRILAVGTKTEAIIQKYNDCLQETIMFDPTHIVLHEGHNHMAFHQAKNILPEISRDVVAQTMGFADDIQRNFPNANIKISASFPRSLADGSDWSNLQVCAYNERMKRHGQRIRTQATRHNLGHVMNNFTWKKISKHVEDSSIYLIDGLHLNDKGRKKQIHEWLLALLGPAEPDSESEA